MSGSSSTTRARGFIRSLRSGCPALRIGEHDAENATAAGPRLVEQQWRRCVWQSSREMKRPRPVPPAPAREERLEDSLGVLGSMPWPRSATSRNGRPRGSRRPMRSSTAIAPAAALAVLDRVVAQVPEDLVQVRRVDTALRRRASRDERSTAPLVRARSVCANSSRNPSTQARAAGAPGRVVSRRDSRQHVLDDLADAVAVLRDDVRQPLVFARSARRLARAAGGVAHRADRIADLVRDAGARSRPSAASLDCWIALGEQRRVLEEDHDAAVQAAAAERREVRPHDRAAVGRHERHLRRDRRRCALAPRGRADTSSCGRDLAEQRARHGAAAPSSWPRTR